MGKDVKQADGKFRFTVHDVVPFFVYLHNLVEKLINANAIALQKGNILIDCLDKMARNKELRDCPPKNSGFLYKIKTANTSRKEGLKTTKKVAWQFGNNLG